MNLNILYIDPGTGSALFSIFIGAAATLYFVGRALFIRLKVVLTSGKAVSISPHSFVIYCEGKQYWNVFKPVLDEFEKRETEILYLTSSEDDPVFNLPWSFVKAEYIGEGNRAFARLNILQAKICLMTTPGLNVYQLKRSKMTAHYSHVLHMTNDATLYRLFGIDYFDSILLTGSYQANDIRVLEKQRGLPAKNIITVGCSYLDVYAEKIKNIPAENNHTFTVLVSPSWGNSALLAKYGEKLLDPLVKTEWRIIVRPHPQSKKSENAMLDKLTERYGDNIIWDYELENIHALAKADVMISDFSGIIYDFVFLRDKPVFYVKQGMDIRPYDAGDLGDDALEKLWQFKTLREIGIELKEEHFADIGEHIKKAADSETLRNARNKARNTAWQYPGEAGGRIADFMIETVRNHDE
ncbi:MAG: CDP-glycerol glycerophosphotransferase family protein [Treponema sp.]|nr:CDP-glycerol glycerophosphotransferase family protein [Treponema sp.]